MRERSGAQCSSAGQVRSSSGRESRMPGPPPTPRSTCLLPADLVRGRVRVKGEW